MFNVADERSHSEDFMESIYESLLDGSFPAESSVPMQSNGCFWGNAQDGGTQALFSLGGQQNQEEECPGALNHAAAVNQKLDISAEKVLSMLDEVLSQRIDTKLSNFQVSLQDMLNDQHKSILHLLKVTALSRQSPMLRLSQFILEEQTTDFPSQTDSSQSSQTDSQNMDVLKYQYLTKMLTSGSILSHALRRKEYSA
ncbi:uncharacterized protein LOC106156184 [Lingula anatina]|uniref:Uncharacterized protein LOC106156184 n=1 Tax=Lingula anatina TaxID=7574 RepID=A0A1S3HKX3_LINAN|nr:uncharacterized protein LOC106156184 [Lingula anatina]|eukprot:XP_013386760.1 uncharacterized protein LOC106156184 [Lingula anatina]